MLCPTGEHARIVSFHSLPADMQSKVLNQWAEFYDMPVSLVTQKKEYMPSLITIRTASQDTVVYPSALVFVPTDTKQSPAAVAGMNGIMGLNHGLTEDLGAKASRMAYYEKLRLNTQEKDATIDYWSYRDPIIHIGSSVFHALSSIDAKYQQDQMLLHRALIEPVVGSPIMNAKSVVPTNYDSPLLASGLHRKSITPPASSAQHECSMQLSEYVTTLFHDNTSGDDTMLDLLQDPSVAAVQRNDSLDIDGGSHLSALLNKTLMIDSTDNLPLSTTSNDAAEQPQLMEPHPTVIQPHADAMPTKDEPQTLQSPLEDFNLMYDLEGTRLHKTDAWDADDGFGDLDLDVTDADFDFFETPAVAAAPPPLPPSPPPIPATELNVLNIIPMDIDSPKTDPAQVEVKQEPLEQDMVMEDVLVSETKLKPTPNNNDSLFTPFVVSNDSTENVSTTATLEEASYTVTPKMPDTFTLQKRASYQKSTPEPFSFVPRDFLPVPVKATVNDAKYGAGGKFMYNPSKDQYKADGSGFAVSKSKESIFYSPDYVPIAPKKKLTKSKQQQVSDMEADPSLETSWSNKVRNQSSSDNGSSSNSSESSSSSSSDSDSFTTDDGEEDSQDSATESESDIDKMDENIGSEGMVEKRFKALKKFQKSIIYSQIKATPAPLPTDRLQYLDYDTPFAPILAYGSIKPIKWRHSKAMEESLAHLCEQAVLGGYPLAGGLAEVSENGGEIEGEPAKVLVARRNNLMQMTRGVVTHMPTLQADVFNMTTEFRDILQDIFIEAVDENEASGMDLITTPDALEPVSYPHGPLLGKVGIKGPLNIQEYYDLNGMYKCFFFGC